MPVLRLLDLWIHADVFPKALRWFCLFLHRKSQVFAAFLRNHVFLVTEGMPLGVETGVICRRDWRRRWRGFLYASHVGGSRGQISFHWGRAIILFDGEDRTENEALNWLWFLFSLCVFFLSSFFFRCISFRILSQLS